MKGGKSGYERWGQPMRSRCLAHIQFVTRKHEDGRFSVWLSVKNGSLQLVAMADTEKAALGALATAFYSGHVFALNTNSLSDVADKLELQWGEKNGHLPAPRVTP
tara:strand:- start:501 stop:815 length:315 start_codon:yes stop_codon:yes gene_type:complete